jgi:hypothetical protein
MSDTDTRIQVVRGDLDPSLGEEIVSFWIEQGALTETVARQRLGDVVAILRGVDGEIAGVNSVYADEVELIGNRTFWIYRCFLQPGNEGQMRPMIDAAYARMNEEHALEGGGPIGLLVLVDGESDLPDAAVWPGDPPFLYAGHLPGGVETRIAYFDGALIGPGSGAQGDLEPKLAPGLRIEVFAEQDEVTEQDVIDLWEREGAVVGEEARRRILEVLLVGIHDEAGVVGVSSAYLQRNPQLDLPLWYYRAFVSSRFRMGSMAILLALRGRDLLKQRYVEGADTRASGLIYEVENPGLKTYFNHATWLPTQFTFIGENVKGDHVRVHYFPGARAPLPG